MPASPYDLLKMSLRAVSAFLVAAAVSALGESYPTSWNYFQPDANSFVGINIDGLRLSPLFDVARSQVGNLTALNIPAPRFLLEASQIVFANPGNLAILSGQWTLADVRKQAAAVGMKPWRYRTIDLMLGPEGSMSIALVSEQALLLGERKELMVAIDRAQPGQLRTFNPLWARAARMAASDDFWILSTGPADALPDGVAPSAGALAKDITGIELGVSLREGLSLDAAITTKTDKAARFLLERMKKSIPDLPEVARGLNLTLEPNTLRLQLTVDREELARSLREAQQAMVARANQPPPEPPVPPEKQVIRIYGLDEGVREIPLKKP